MFRKLPDNRYETMERLSLVLDEKNTRLFFAVPKGFEFDVSVPRLLRWIFDPDDPRFLRAAAFHDYALMQGLPRDIAAIPFSHELRAAGVGRLKRLAMVIAVITWRWK